MMNRRKARRTEGFTLIELLVVIVIVAALASLVFMMANRGILKAQKAQTLQQMRDVGLAIEAFSIDYRRPPIPPNRLAEGVDTIYGDSGGLGSEVIIGALIGSDEEFSDLAGAGASSRQLNPRGENYYRPILVDDRRSGVGRGDGKLYDAWGGEIMFAVNTPPFEQDSNQGVRDKILFTRNLAEWNDKKPRYQSHVLWSYGKDGVKSDSYAKSDDVANF